MFKVELVIYRSYRYNIFSIEPSTTIRARGISLFIGGIKDNMIFSNPITLLNVVYDTDCFQFRYHSLLLACITFAGTKT